MKKLNIYYKYNSYKISAQLQKYEAHTSNIYKTKINNQPLIIKDHFQHDLYNGVLPLSNKNFRKDVIEKEYKSLLTLAPTSEPEISIMNDSNEKREVLVMKAFHQKDFLHNKVKKEKKLDKKILKNTAEQVINFQNIQNGTDIDPIKFYSDVFKTEYSILKTLPISKKLENTEGMVQSFIKKNKKIFLKRSAHNCLYDGHGDLILRNIAVNNSSSNNNVNIFDIAPLEKWRLADKRMDALFFSVDLEMNKLNKESIDYWDFYNKLSTADKKFKPKELKVVDLLSRLYRWIINYRINLISKQLEKMKICLEKILQILKEISSLNIIYK